MHTYVSRTAVVVAAMSLAVGLTTCGKAREAGEPGGKARTEAGLRIGVLIPGLSRWARFDRPLLEQQIKELCGSCTVVSANALADANAQRQQADSMMANGAKVLILGAVDTKSGRSIAEKGKRAHIPVVAYDRLPEGPVSAYISFDNEQVGRLQGTALLDAVSQRDRHAGQIVMINGSPNDPNSAMFKKGALSVLKGKVRIGKAYDTDWKPEIANSNMASAIAALGANTIDGVYAANDSLASGAITALKRAEVQPLPPVVGQDADLSAVQRIVAGEQYMTVYKPYRAEARAAARVALALGRGQDLKRLVNAKVSSPTTKDVPATLISPVSLTVRTIKSTVVKDGTYTLGEICPTRLKPACEKAGLIR